jgi:hypothetical protein
MVGALFLISPPPCGGKYPNDINLKPKVIVIRADFYFFYTQGGVSHTTGEEKS